MRKTEEIGVTKGEKVLGMPVNLEGYGLIYNKKVFEEAGVDAAAIQTMADLRAAAEAIDSKKDDLGLDAVFALAAKDFIDWMYTSDTGKEAVLSEFKFIPAYEGYDAEGIADPLSKEIYQFSQDGNTSAWVFPNYPVGWSDQLGAELQKYFAGEATWEEAISSMQDEWAKARQ